MPSWNARSLASRTAWPFFASFLRIPRITPSRTMPNQPERSPRTTVFFALSVPVAWRAISPMGTGNTSAGFTPASGSASGATPVAAS